MEITLEFIEHCYDRYPVHLESLFVHLAPILFTKSIDQKTSIQNRSATILQSGFHAQQMMRGECIVLADCADCYSGDLLWSACLDALNVLKMPKCFPEIFKYLCHCLKRQPQPKVPSQAHLIRRGICQILSYSADKNPTVRQTSSQLVEDLIASVSKDVLRQHLNQADPEERV